MAQDIIGVEGVDVRWHYDDLTAGCLGSLTGSEGAIGPLDDAGQELRRWDTSILSRTEYEGAATYSVPGVHPWIP